MKFEGVELEFELGPLEQLLDDADITEIMVNGTNPIYIEKRGEMIETDLRFDDEDHVLRVINNICEPLGRYVNEAFPIVDARLPDGSRVNAVIRPIALTGPTLTLLKFPKHPLTWDDLTRFGSVAPKIIEFLRACVQAKLNIGISGGTSSGKTTIINAMSEFIPEKERIITIETAAELQLRHKHVVVLETRPPQYRR